MATDDRVTQPNTIGQLSELDSEQAFEWFINFTIDSLCSFGALLIRNALDAGKPEMANQIKCDFLELLRNNLPNMLRQAWDEFRQLWPQLQLILCEIKDNDFKIVDHHWATISGALDSMRNRNYISPQVSNEELLADVLQGEHIIKQIPPRHSLLNLLGVENEGQWNKLTSAQKWARLFYMITKQKQPFLRIATKLIHRWAEDSSTNSVSQEQMAHGDEVLETIEAKTSKPLEYLSDTERLSQFCELVGIEMNTLTDSDSSLVLDLLHALDMGYNFASKQGVSMQAYFGDKADSKKTQRQRLFKKLKDIRGKAK